MSQPAAPWWETTPAGTKKLLAFVKLDRAGSTRDWSDLTEDQALRRRRDYVSGIEYIADQFGAAQPLHFQGDGVMLFLPDGDEPAPVRALQCAQLLWQRMRVDLNLSARIAVHAADVTWDPDTGKLAHPAIDLCGHLEHAAPENGVAVTEDVYLVLPEKLRAEFAPLGVTVRDGTPAYVWPASAAAHRSGEHFCDSRDLELWGAFRRYAMSAEIRMLRYVGLRLHKRQPPSLDVRDVFVPMRVQSRRGAPLSADAMREVGEALAVASRAESGKEPSSDFIGEFPWARVATQLAAAPEPFEEMFRKHRSAVVLGDPGSGKTTLLRWLAVTACSGRLGLGRQLGVAERLLPLPISVGRLAEVRRALGDTASVADALARYFHDRSVGDEGDLRPFLIARLEAGECLVLLDGLDEVRGDERAALRGWLESFVARYANNRYVTTSRSVGYAGFALPELVEFTLQPFEDEQVERYVETFHREYVRWETPGQDPVGEAAKLTESLLHALEGSTRLKALARNPFLLSALALIHRAEGRLPRHRVQVYQIFAQALCETWGSARRLVASTQQPEISYEGEAIPILGHLALRMHEEWPTGAAPEAFVLKTLADALCKRKGIAVADAEHAAREFLRRAGDEVQLLLERGPGQWGFLHLTFQEFFAAAGLLSEERFEEVALEHIVDPRWEELIRLGVGYMALVQHRDQATRRFIDRVARAQLRGDLAWVTSVLHKQRLLGALLTLDAAEILSAAEATRRLKGLLASLNRMPPRSLAPVLTEVVIAGLADLAANCLAAGWCSGQSARRLRSYSCLVEMDSAVLAKFSADPRLARLVGFLQFVRSTDRLPADWRTYKRGELDELARVMSAHVRTLEREARGIKKVGRVIAKKGLAHAVVETLRQIDRSEASVGAIQALWLMAERWDVLSRGPTLTSEPMRAGVSASRRRGARSPAPSTGPRRRPSGPRPPARRR